VAVVQYTFTHKQYVYTLFTIWRRCSGERKNLGEQWMPRAEEIFPRATLDRHVRLVSPSIDHLTLHPHCHVYRKVCLAGSAVCKTSEFNYKRNCAGRYQEMRIKLNCLLSSRAIIPLCSIVSTRRFILSQRGIHPVLVLRLNLSALTPLANYSAS
jgi:hypothetical protein